MSDTATKRALPPNLEGAIWVIFGGIVFAAMHALVKYLGDGLPAVEIAFFRCFFALLFIAPMLLRANGFAFAKTSHPWLQIGRGLCGAGAMLTLFWALKYAPLAEVTALVYSRPLFMIVLAVILLGEAIRWRRWTATAVGFLGVLIMVRPSGELNIALLGAIGHAMCAALGWSLVKMLTNRGEQRLTILFYFTLVPTLVLAIPTALEWVTPTVEQAVCLAIVGGGLSIGHYCVIRGLSLAETTAVMPFDYGRLLFAAIIGFFAFGEIPGPWTLLGAAIIVASTAYIAQREARLGDTAKN